MSPVPANNRDIKKEEEEGDISAADAPQFAIDNSDSDSEGGEEDPDGYQGYQLLPQDPDGGDNGQDVIADPPPVPPTPASAVDHVIMQSLDNQDMMNAVALQGQDVVPDPLPSERAEVWNSAPPASASSIPMDPEHVEKIRLAMSGFSLPASAQPSWAGQLSDEEWKEFLRSQNSSGGVASGKNQHTSRQAKFSADRDKTIDR